MPPGRRRQCHIHTPPSISSKQASVNYLNPINHIIPSTVIDIKPKNSRPKSAFLQRRNSLLRSLPQSPSPEERLSAKQMRQCSRAPDKRRRFASPRQRANGSHSYIPKVLARLRTVQLVSGGTRRCVQISAPPPVRYSGQILLIIELRIIAKLTFTI
jgi:hypothetical protein